MWDIRFRHGAAASLLILSVGSPLWAWTSLAEGQKGKLEMETRVMFWGVSAGRDSVPGGTPVQVEDIRDFSLRRARLLFRAQVPQKLEIYIQFGQDNVGSKIAADETGLRIKDFYLNYQLKGDVQITVGQFRIPFLRQSLESAFNQLLVDRALLTALRPAREGSRDIGAMVWGNLRGFQYRAALFDGSDQEDSNSRTVSRKELRLAYNWFTLETGSGYTGTSIGEKRVLQVGLQADAQNHRLDPRDDAGFTLEPRDYLAHAADLFLDLPFKDGSAFTLEGARMRRTDDYENPALERRRTSGFYAQAGYLFPWHVGTARLQLAVRDEDLDTGRGAVESSVRNRTVGVTLFGQKGHDRKLQMDYTHSRERPVDLDTNELRVSVVAVF